MRKGMWVSGAIAALLAVAVAGSSRGLPTAPAGQAGADEAKLTPAVSFNSTVAFRVYAVKSPNRVPELVGTTPSDKPLEIPPCLFWYVTPIPPVDMEKVAREVQEWRIPRIRLAAATATTPATEDSQAS